MENLNHHQGAIASAIGALQGNVSTVAIDKQGNIVISSNAGYTKDPFFDAEQEHTNRLSSVLAAGGLHIKDNHTIDIDGGIAGVTAKAKEAGHTEVKPTAADIADLTTIGQDLQKAEPGAIKGLMNTNDPAFNPERVNAQLQGLAAANGINISQADIAAAMQAYGIDTQQQAPSQQSSKEVMGNATGRLLAEYQQQAQASSQGAQR